MTLHKLYRGNLQQNVKTATEREERELSTADSMSQTKLIKYL